MFLLKSRNVIVLSPGYLNNERRARVLHFCAVNCIQSHVEENSLSQVQASGSRSSASDLPPCRSWEHQQVNLYIASPISHFLNHFQDTQNAFVSDSYPPKDMRLCSSSESRLRMVGCGHCSIPLLAISQLKARLFTDFCGIAERQDHSGRNIPKRLAMRKLGNPRINC